MKTIDNIKLLSDFEGEDIIDSRDIIKSMEALEDIIEDKEEPKANRKQAKEELILFENFVEELQNSTDWVHGETLINENYFTEYVKELLVDCGYFDKDLPDFIEIDWDATAENLKIDYMESNGYLVKT